MEKSAHFTGSTAYNAMGFHGFSGIRSHFREFVYKKGPPTVDAEMQAHMQHSIRNEVSDY